ncbi:differentially expressed in FDCP 6 homolog [Montipora capricornis]|uniref:differentially expressed in FDCP 6 homolog n=1 Tax=Montipora foliosa TaxID=591990 RepID=UPI0035F212AE
MAILTTREATLKEGYLFKQSRTVWKLWKARFFILKTTGLFYYKKKSHCSGLALGVIAFRDISMQVDEVGDKKRKFCLKIHADGKTFSLCCFSEEERNSWMAAILTAVTSFVIERHEGERLDDEYVMRERSLSRSKSLDAIDRARIKPSGTSDKANGLSASATDLDRIVFRETQKTPLAKRKQKAFSHWDFKKRSSYISFDLI